MGRQWLISEKLYSDFELAYFNIHPLERFHTGTTDDFRFSINAGLNLGSRLSVNAGPLLHWYVYKPTDTENVDFTDRFGGSAFREVAHRSSLRKMWIGYQAAIRF